MGHKGEVIYGLDQTALADEAPHLLGFKGEFPDLEYDSSEQIKGQLSANLIEAWWVKNASGGILLPGEMVNWTLSAIGETVSQKAAASVPAAGVVSPFIPAAGVADGRHFYLIRSGPTKLIQSGGGAFSAGDLLVPAANGRAVELAGTATDSADNLILSCFGRALEDCVITAGTKFRAFVNFRF